MRCTSQSIIGINIYRCIYDTDDVSRFHEHQYNFYRKANKDELHSIALVDNKFFDEFGFVPAD